MAAYGGTASATGGGPRTGLGTALTRPQVCPQLAAMPTYEQEGKAAPSSCAFSRCPTLGPLGKYKDVSWVDSGCS